MFKHANEIANEKIRVFERNFIYEYDTLELPFIDDFSVNHFPERIIDTSSTRLRDSLVFALLENGVAVTDTFGFTTDTTYTYFLSTAGDTNSVSVNNTRTISFANLDSSVLFYNTFTVFPAYNINDIFATRSDTIAVEADYSQDTATFYIVAPNSNDYYTDRSAYLNNTFAIDPPSIGVVTFDGLDEFGMPYNFDFDLTVRADVMTSVPINLGNLPDTNVYFSFFYEPKGLSIDKPEREDSLVLEFYNPTNKKWGFIWRIAGFEADTFAQEIIKVPNNYHQNGFRFRFRNYANSTGAFDQWHIDYLYLNNGRSASDTIYKDIAYRYDPEPLLKDYYAMPWFHYINDPASYMTDTARSVVVNNFNESFNLYNKLEIPDTTTGMNFFSFPDNFNSFIPFKENSIINLRYQLDGFFFPADKVTGPGTFLAYYDIDFRPSSTQEPDFIRSNDSVVGKTILENYYAYDDGTAEAGYGINPALSNDGLTAFMAVEFNTPFANDTLGGIQMYFLPQAVDVSKQRFTITVWNSLSPPSIIYEKTVSNNPVYSDDNGYLNYGFDSTILVSGTFYVGFKAVGANSLNVGYDLNSNSRNKIFWSQDGVGWNNPSIGIRDGSLMLRPFFRTRLVGVGLEELGSRNKENSIVNLYPNPVRNAFSFELTANNKLEAYRITDISGKLLMEKRSFFATSLQGEGVYQYKESVNVSTLKNGMYLLFIKQEGGMVHSKKFIVSQQ